VTDEDLELRARAEQVRAQAATLPGPGEVRDLAGHAIAHGGAPGMSMDDIRELADRAVDSAEQVTVLLRRLSDLLGDSAGGEP
jgi:hypothetical protein